MQDDEVAAIAARMERLLAHDDSKISLQTPDNAVKSWWTLFDSVVEFENVTCRIARRANVSWIQKALTASLTPDATIRFLHGDQCVKSSWRRTIDEVKAESETRAVVFATVWSNDAPTPAASNDEIEVAKRGTKFRYVLEKVGGKWLIADMFRFKPKTTYSAEMWDRVYDGKSAEFFFGTVYQQ